MRRWRSLGPYNAGQVMHVSGEADLERWQHAIEQTVREVGLGRPVALREGRAVAFRPVAEIPVHQHTGDFTNFINAELNEPFAEEAFPIRFAVLPQPEGGHYLVAIYDHWIADSRAMRELMHRIWERYRRRDGTSPLPALTLHAPYFTRLFRKHIGYLYRSRAIRESLKNLIRHRRAHRINLTDPLDFHARMIYASLPAGLIERVHHFAKARHASVNDVFLSVLGQIIGEFTAPERYRKRHKRFHLARDRVGLGTIVDIRDAARQPLDQVFGLYLSSYTVLLQEPEKKPFEQLVQSIAQRTGRIKRRHGAVKGYTALMMARLSWDLFPKIGKGHLQGQLFHKNVPVTAGISNVNMTRSWVDEPAPTPRAGEHQPMILDYLRISPAGPFAPLVYTLTTIGDRLSLCCTYRTTAFTDVQVKQLVAQFIARLGEAVK